jgi:hypothetical protein
MTPFGTDRVKLGNSEKGFAEFIHLRAAIGLELRGMYEPFIFALSKHFLLTLPPRVPESAHADNWQTSVSTPERGRIRVVSSRRSRERHF